MLETLRRLLESAIAKVHLSQNNVDKTQSSSICGTILFIRLEFTVQQWWSHIELSVTNCPLSTLEKLQNCKENYQIFESFLRIAPTIFFNIALFCQIAHLKNVKTSSNVYYLVFYNSKSCYKIVRKNQIIHIINVLVSLHYHFFFIIQFVIKNNIYT